MSQRKASRQIRVSVTVRWRHDDDDILSLKEHPAARQRTASRPATAPASEKGTKRPSPESVLLLVDVLVPDDLVGDPVEDIEDEEGQGEGRPGDGVYPLGSVHKLLLHGVHVFGDRRRRVGGRGGVFDGRAVLGRRGLAHVAGKIKAAFADVFILRNMTAERKRVNARRNRPSELCCQATSYVLPEDQLSKRMLKRSLETITATRIR